MYRKYGLNWITSKILIMCYIGFISVLFDIKTNLQELVHARFKYQVSKATKYDNAQQIEWNKTGMMYDVYILTWWMQFKLYRQNFQILVWYTSLFSILRIEIFFRIDHSFNEELFQNFFKWCDLNDELMNSYISHQMTTYILEHIISEYI